MTQLSLFAWLPVAGVVLILILIALLVSRQGRRAPPRRDSYLEGLKWLVNGDERRALKSLKSAISEDPDNLDAFLRLGDLLRKLGHCDKALQVHRQLTIRPGLSKEAKRGIYWSLVHDYISLGNNAKAISLLEELTTLGSRDVAVYEEFLNMYEKESRWDEALKARKVISGLKGEDSSLLALYYSWVGQKLLARGEKRGNALVKQALKIDPACVSALITLGDTLHEDGKVSQAITTWRKVVDETPKLAFLTFDRLERAYFEEGKFGEMERIYEDLLQREPRDLRVLLALARIYEKKADREGALRVFNRILDIDPSSAFARSGLLRFHAERGEVEKAAEQARTLAELSLPREEGYVCSNCGLTSLQYLWRCPECKEWRTFA